MKIKIAGANQFSSESLCGFSLKGISEWTMLCWAGLHVEVFWNIEICKSAAVRSSLQSCCCGCRGCEKWAAICAVARMRRRFWYSQPVCQLANHIVAAVGCIRVCVCVMQTPRVRRVPEGQNTRRDNTKRVHLRLWKLKTDAEAAASRERLEISPFWMILRARMNFSPAQREKRAASAICKINLSRRGGRRQFLNASTIYQTVWWIMIWDQRRKHNFSLATLISVAVRGVVKNVWLWRAIRLAAVFCVVCEKFHGEAQTSTEIRGIAQWQSFNVHQEKQSGRKK